MYVKEVTRRLSLYNKDLAWDDSRVLKRDPVSLTYSAEYVNSVSGTLSLQQPTGNESGMVEVYLGLNKVSDVESNSPTFSFSFINGVFVDTPIIPETFLSFNSNKKIIIRTVPVSTYTYTSCTVKVSLSYVFDFVASLPVDGYEQKEVDRVSGISLPLMKFYPD